MTSSNSSFETTDSISSLRDSVRKAREAGLKIGFVPTMGALHEGHLSLIREALEKTDFVVVSLFVNPTQFAPNEDFSKYPRPIQEDLNLCQKEGAHLVFHPEIDEIYSKNHCTTVSVSGISERLEGKFRPTHFDGVTTVVLKLFNIVLPDISFFGQKDYQQQLLIKQMAQDLNLPVEVCTCPTIREPDGLAMSSRNRYLTEEERKTALLVPESLDLAEKLLKGGGKDFESIREEMKSLLNSGVTVKVDYVSLSDPQSLVELQSPQSEIVVLVAAYVGSTRLIDNRLIRLSTS